MKRVTKFFAVMAVVSAVSGCKVETHTDEYYLSLSYSAYYDGHYRWAAAASILLAYYDLYYSQSEVVDYHTDWYGYGSPSSYELSSLLWHLGTIDSYVTGTLNFSEIRSELRFRRPVLIHYGDDYSGHYVVLYGYDHSGYVYLHDPSYGTRVVHYDDLFSYEMNGITYYWNTSIVLLN